MENLKEVSLLLSNFDLSFIILNVENCTSLLAELKVLLTKFPSLPPTFEQTPNFVEELTIARDVYEKAVLFHVENKDQDAFERDFLQLKTFYMDTRGVIPPSSRESEILGLNLLRLLVQNRIAEFHTEIEPLQANELENPCIKHIVELEQSLMEGAYVRALRATTTVACETYDYFMDLLSNTIRDVIAGSIEAAYDYLSIADAKRILMFSSDKKLSQYTKKHPEWEIKNDGIFFKRTEESPACIEMRGLRLITKTIGYAREMERVL